MDIKICQGMGASDADSKLLCSSGMNGCPPQVFRVLSAELPYEILQPYNTYCNIRLRQNSPLDLILTYMDDSSEHKTANNTKRMYCYYYPC